MFYQVIGFKGSAGSKSELDVAYFNQVLDNKVGSIFTLGMLYLQLAKLLDLEVVAVEVPQTFLLANLNSLTESILFYINPLSKGRILSGEEVKSELNKIGIVVNEGFEQSISNHQVIIKYLYYLKTIYKNRSMETQVKDVEKMIEIVEKNLLT